MRTSYMTSLSTRITRLAFGLALSTAGAAAQSLNIDCGTAFGPPADSYRGAAGQPGRWNEFPGNTTDPVELLDLGGFPSGIMFASALPVGPASFDHPATAGDDQALLDDYLSLNSTPHLFDISGLAPGNYRVLTFAWAPHDALIRTAVDVNDSGGVQVGGDWPGAHAQGVTYARHDVPLDAGQTLTISMRGLDTGALNGFQITFLDAVCTGDLDADQTVGLSDLAILLAHFGSAGANPGDGDYDGDLDVDLSDLAFLLANFGNNCA